MTTKRSAPVPLTLPLTVPRVIVEIVLGGIGAALLILAIGANQQWLDRHFLPSFLLPREWYVRAETSIRLAMAIAGAVLAFVVRPRVGRLVARAPGSAARIILAAVLALAASEPMLRRVHLQPAEWLLPDEEPRRQPDPRLGWTFMPARAGHATIGGRVVEYAFDAAGYRVRRIDDPVDPARPTILFTGESVMFGEGLTWEESIPAQVGAMMGIQSANLAVHGFGSDQAYLRLQSELPRFRQPVAVVSLFMPALFGRNLDHERPHLGPGLTWLPGTQRWRLHSLASLLVPYHHERTIDEAITLTREVLQATVALAHTRGAAALIIVPQFGTEGDAEERLRHQILDAPESRVPYERIEIDPTWRLPWDRHPNPHAARAIATAIAARLRR
jgi:hypothetical protein